MRPARVPVPARLGRGLWRLLTSVDFAVAQIIVLALLAVVGMTIRQLPDFAFRSASDYAAAIDDLHARYDPLLGTAIVDVMERLSVFSVFRSVWFSAGLTVLVISIVVCTLDRTPRLWRGVTDIRVDQPEPFFDPRLPDRAAMDAVPLEGVRAVLRRAGFRIREAALSDGTRFVYGDRHQYTKLATLFTHTGLVLFLVAAAVTSRLGEEQGLVVPEGQSLTVQPIGTPGLLLVKNLDFQAPGFETGQASDFTTDLAVYQDGREIARKTIRVNDPLSIGGYTFHQNGFGPAPYLVVRDAEGAPLWDGAVPLTDAAAGSPYGIVSVPGRDLGLQLLLRRQADGTGIVLILPYRVVGTRPDGSPIPENYAALALAKGETGIARDVGLTIELRDVSEYTLLIAKRDPGQGIVWLAFASLIAGITITFYLPRRRVWTRLTPDGRLGIVWRSDRYIDVEREFGRLLDQLVAARQRT
ncbi:MAG TPA: cytochrome c biogenesis protein ResB [Candidatus Limnocylindrales bacterium]|nr:cytochrome c biogenesis protein ResB [Candidatus Limnocylindrales bacterium]